MKGLVHVLQPRQVDLNDIAAVWKVEQKIERPGRPPQVCVATIQLRRNGTVRTSFRGEEVITPYTFRPHRWPRACTIEFDAYAFQGPYDPEPLLKHYRGEFSRNLMDPSIITLSGTIYDMKVRFSSSVISHCAREGQVSLITMSAPYLGSHLYKLAYIDLAGRGSPR